MQYRWVLQPEQDPQITQQLASQLNDLPEALATILVARGIDSFDKARYYFRPGLANLHDPFMMADMDAAVNRILEAHARKERVMVYGDYDVDGTTATALMTSFLQEIGIDASYWIPDRIQDGYGLCNAGIDEAKVRSAALIIALDCGITAVDEAAYARKQGLDLIICDHHKPAEVLPDAVAVLDPKRTDCPYPFKELSGCGIGYKVVQAVLERMNEAPERAHPYLDLVAISTASDIVPMEDENRVLMMEGLNRMREAPSLGIQSLAKVAGVDLATCATSQIVFSIGPRINAAGRLGDAQRAVELLMSQEVQRASEIAQELEQANQERRAMDRSTMGEAAIKAERQLGGDLQHGIVVHDESWHPGVIGIVASRLVERFYRPSIILTTVNGVVKGSARSINGINIYNALKQCEDLLITFGGHDYAAGMALEEKSVAAFRERFNGAVGKMITPELLVPAIEVDALLCLDDVSTRFWAVLKQFEPFGPANLQPIFQATDLVVTGTPRCIGKGGAHLKFCVKQDRGHRAMDVIGFNMSQHHNTLLQSQAQDTPLELLFSIEENTWRGNTTLQLKARDLRLQKMTTS